MKNIKCIIQEIVKYILICLLACCLVLHSLALATTFMLENLKKEIKEELMQSMFEVDSLIGQIKITLGDSSIIHKIDDSGIIYKIGDKNGKRRK